MKLNISLATKARIFWRPYPSIKYVFLCSKTQFMACASTTKCNIMNNAFDTNQRKCHPFYAIKQRNDGKETMLTYKCILNGHFAPLWGPICAEFCRLRWRNWNHNPPDHPSRVQKIPYDARSFYLPYMVTGSHQALSCKSAP